jgi:hypothetical protein
VQKLKKCIGLLSAGAIEAEYLREVRALSMRDVPGKPCEGSVKNRFTIPVNRLWQHGRSVFRKHIARSIDPRAASRSAIYKSTMP